MAERLLLVDDEPALREAVKAYLENFGFAVDVATNGEEGWQMVQQNHPDLVITDVMMPGVDGYQLLKRLREDPQFKPLPVVFLTARGMTSDRILGYQARCDAYLSKPFDPDELVAIVENLLERRNAIVLTPPPIKIDFTPREQSVLELVAQGLMNKEIARRLETSVRNVEKYVSRLFSKTGTNSRTELVRYALEHGLTQ
jgi:DNA-binding NarL/FixJ family response regulator